MRTSLLLFLIVSLTLPAFAEAPNDVTPEAALDAFFAAVDAGDEDALRAVMSDLTEGDKLTTDAMAGMLKMHGAFHAALTAFQAKYPDQHLDPIDAELSQPGKPKLGGTHSPLDEFYKLRDQQARKATVNKEAGTAVFHVDDNQRPEPLQAIKTDAGWKLHTPRMAGGLAQKPEMAEQLAKEFAAYGAYYEELAGLIESSESLEALRKAAGEAYMKMREQR